MSDQAPAWLATLRALDGTREFPGGDDNPVIMGWRDRIARAFPDLAEYARGYTHDSIAWCGLTVAFAMAANGIRPPSTFLWAKSWAGWGKALAEPRLGCVMVFTRDGGGHVALYEGETRTHYRVRGGNQSDQLNVQSYPKSRCIGMRWPAGEPAARPAADHLPDAGTMVGAELVGIGRSTDPSTATLRQDVPPSPVGRSIPASIRYNNPGAQYPSAEAARFGQAGFGVIGGGHKIALFPHPVNGAAANLELLRRRYVGMTIGDAGTKWTGANGFGVPGYDPDGLLTAEMIDDPEQAIPLMQAIARREAGRESPLTPVQWRAAHAMFRAGSADAWLAGRGRAPAGGPKPVAAKPVAATLPTPIALPDRPSVLGTVLGWLRRKPAEPPSAAAVAAAARPGLSPGGDPQLYDLQALLAAKGWAMVGRADGEMGPNTRAAILAFRNENGLPVNSDVDDALYAAVAKAPIRQVAASRAGATTRDVAAAGTPGIGAARDLGLFGGITALGAAADKLQASGVIDQVGATLDSVQGAAATIASIAGTATGAVAWVAAHWQWIAIGLGVWMLLRAVRWVAETVALFRRGVINR